MPPMFSSIFLGWFSTLPENLESYSIGFKHMKGEVKEHVYKGPMDKDNEGRIEYSRGGWAGQG